MALADIVGQIESGSTTANPNSGAVSSSGARGFLQQFKGFQQQYAGNFSGTASIDPDVQIAGLNNFANQTLAANPNITFGDFYGAYHSGTGVPGAGPTFSSLTSGQQTQVSNVINPDTPLSSIVNSSAGNDSIPVPGGVAVSDITIGGQSGATDVQASGEGVSGPAGANIGGGASSGGSLYGGKLAQTATTIPDAVVKAGNAVTSGVNGAVETAKNVYNDIVTKLPNYFLRGGVMFLAIVLMLVAGILLIPTETKARIVKGVMK